MVKVVAVFLSTIVMVLSLQDCQLEEDRTGSIKILSVNTEIGRPAAPDKFWTIFNTEVAYEVKNCDYGGRIFPMLVIDACNTPPFFDDNYPRSYGTVAEGEGTITLRSLEVMACESGRMYIELFGRTDRYTRFWYQPNENPYYYERVFLDSDEIDY